MKRQRRLGKRPTLVMQKETDFRITPSLRSSEQAWGFLLPGRRTTHRRALRRRRARLIAALN